MALDGIPAHDASRTVGLCEDTTIPCGTLDETCGVVGEVACGGSLDQHPLGTVVSVPEVLLDILGVVACDGSGALLGGDEVGDVLL